MQALVSLRQEDSRLVPGGIHNNKSGEKVAGNPNSAGVPAAVEKVQILRHKPADSFQLPTRCWFSSGQSLYVWYRLSYSRSVRGGINN